MELQFLYPYWGSEGLSCVDFFATVKDNGFSGVEINIPKSSEFQAAFYKSIQQKKKEDEDFVFIAQQVLGLKKETSDEYLKRVLQRLDFISQFQPDSINSHTGKDYFTFSENCKIIESIEEFSLKKGIPIYHEIHRGRFTFHSATTLNYLEIFPNLQFVGDFSHWTVVSESLLKDQDDIIEKIAPNIQHLHARIGTEQASQVNHPFAPEWKLHIDRYTDIWKTVLSKHRHEKKFTITPEFGPYPYMPQSPFDQEPLSNQKEVNIQMKEYLKTTLA